MSITIRQVAAKADLKAFIRFNYELYKNNVCAVPDLYEDMKKTFSPAKNPAFEFCEACLFLACNDRNEIVGRVAAIINRKANEAWNARVVRFGWIDFLDDEEISQSLIQAVEAWGKARGMDTIEGPLGFTDFDAEGMLIEGFDQLGTMATIYNYPYYPQHLERLGFTKAADWVELKIYIPEAIPEKFQRISNVVAKKFELRVRKLKSNREIRQTGIGQEIFRLINDAYTPLFGYSRMTERQIDEYVKTYLPLLDLRMVTLIENRDNELVAVAISMPSLSHALQRAGGKLFPFGWFHLAKALFWKRPKMLDLLLIAVRPDYQGKGVNALLFTDLIPVYQKLGFTYAETNPELEVNDKVQQQWAYYDHEQHKRRRCFTRKIEA